LSNLLKLIKYKNYTVRNVKEEAALVLVHHLFEQYINEIENKNNKIFIEKLSAENKKYIFNATKEIFSYLDKKIISADIMDNILGLSIKEKKYIQQAALLEPIAYFYDILTTSYKNNLKLLKKDENGDLYWLPELLAFSIVLDLKEKGYNFIKFKFIQEFDFGKIMNIYNKISINYTREIFPNKNLFIAHKCSPIKAIQDISINMTNALYNSKYIDMNKQKSNKKSNKRRKNGRRK